jgi:sarcosine oxidase subunit alpha
LSPSAQDTPLEFFFDGRRYRGRRGDTLASALLANGVRVVSRSFKFHRPRGIFTAGLEEPNALVQLHSAERTIPLARATLVPLEADLHAFSHHGWPSRQFDALRVLDLLHPLFAAGFYHKTFMWPSWRCYEPFIRKLTGFGTLPTGPDPDRYDTCHAHCDVLVVGGGTAGIEAASRAASGGARVLLVEQQSFFPGDVAHLERQPLVTCLRHTVAVGYYDHGLLMLVESVAPDGPEARSTRKAQVPRERLWLVRARRVVLATGCIEQPLIFCGNDRPGIMLAGAALKYLRNHSVAPGRKVVVATNNDSAYAAARELHQAGVFIAAVLDSRGTPATAAAEELRALGVRVHHGALPLRTAGFSALRTVTFGSLGADGQIASSETLGCDALLVSGGWSPALQLFAQAGGQLVFDAQTRAFQPAVADGGIEIVGFAAQPSAGELGPRLSPIGDPGRQWVDLLHDVTVADIELAVRENYTNVEHIKRYTTLGMAADQGKLGQTVAAEVIARTRGLKPEELGYTTFRPPLVPVTLGTLVGRNLGAFYTPERRTPIHALQAAAGALCEDFGGWRRAAVFPQRGESRTQAMRREVALVRNGVGLYDASSLGKIELAGPDILEFADRFYIQQLATLQFARVRYGIMLKETGVVFDDGTIVRLDDDRILLTTTSGGAERVACWLEEWRQCEWPKLRVIVAPVTDQWATVTLAGPQARTVLERLRPECELTNAAFPHLSMRVTRLLGSPARIYRVSFSGELSYEINVPAHHGAALWSALMEEGRAFGIAPFGVDALLHLRMEKGFVDVGVDTDGTTVPDDIGFGKAAASKQQHYIGKRSLSLPENVRSDRLQFVGLAAVGATPLPVGGHLRLPDSAEPTDGWVTSAGLLSSALSPVGLAMLRGGRARMGQVVTVHDGGHMVARARVVAPVFYDPSGTRMHA